MQWNYLVLVLLSSVVCFGGEKPLEDVGLSNLVSEIWNKDPNRWKVGEELLLNWQGQISDIEGGKDFAPAPLCTIKSKKFINDSVYKAFVLLLNNYEHRVGFSETETAEERKEIGQFLDVVVNTTTMKSFHKYLMKQKLASPQLRRFKEELYDIWFKPYRRQRNTDSSPFEHIFVGEARQNMVLGMHNWVAFCLKEKDGVFNYFGHSKPHHSDPDFKRSLQFSMHKSFKKPFGTIIFGSSLEFDFGLYTVAYLKSQELFKNSQKWPALVIRLNDTRLLVQCHPLAGNRMGTCYIK